ncbi:hypothetical protein QCA50_003061 [Cerrena zonata]|uniref:ATP synthase subunit e, mitochondrial n=1 Tax=Cerrena zonata TaxID=2478898 RepID=A0AAW0GIK3_9APHY
MAPLLSRTLDPVLGVCTGIFAYYLYESHPRTALPEQDRLLPLLKWKLEKGRKEREAALGAEDEVIDWKALAAVAEEKK